MEVRGRTALVTGAGRRIGRALALALGEAGARVAVHYGNSADDASETATAIRSLGSQAETFQADLRDNAHVIALAERVQSVFGPIEILVNNASIFSKHTLDETTTEEWDDYMAVHARAPYLLAQAMHRALPPGGQGKIINLNDWHTARKDRFAYGVSKSALSGLTRSLAKALAPTVQVNQLALGAILPPVDGSAGETAAGGVGRMGTVNEVTHAMMALIANDFITGETVHVDGGRHIR